MKKIGVFIFLVFLHHFSIAGSIAQSDILLHIATQCVDPSKTNYCSDCTLPRVDANCGVVAECKKTNEVWKLSPEYVAIRDIKMCGCTEDFVHGIAMPRTSVTGVEDPARQEGIWQFAWDIGANRIEEDSLALVVNPRSQRTQNQLHIHLLRLDENARQKWAGYSYMLVNELNNVWELSQEIARSNGLSDYGVLVSKYSPDRFIIVVSKDSPEALFTKWKCN